MSHTRRFRCCAAPLMAPLVALLVVSCRPEAPPDAFVLPTGAVVADPRPVTDPAGPRLWPINVGERVPLGVHRQSGLLEWVRVERTDSDYAPEGSSARTYRVSVRLRNDTQVPRTPRLFVTLWDFTQACSRTLGVADASPDAVPAGRSATLTGKTTADFRAALVSFAEVQ